MEHYVYILVDPRDGDPFYVGKGSGDRVLAHEAEARAGSEHPKCDVIRAIWAEGLEVERRFDSWHGSAEEAYAREEALIDEIGLESLTNLVRGGGSERGRCETVEQLVRRLEGEMTRERLDRIMAASPAWGIVSEWAGDAVQSTVQTFAFVLGIDAVIESARKHGVVVNVS